MSRSWIALLGLVFTLSAVPAGAEPKSESPTFRYVRSVAGPTAAQRYVPHIEKSARRWKLDPVLVARVMRLESGFNPRSVSHVGAIGLMQVMPFHFSKLGIRGAKRFEAATNIDLGCRILAWYMRQMVARYPGLERRALEHRALVAYNMGPRAVVSRGIYRSRYSDIILRRYQPSGKTPAKRELPKAAPALYGPSDAELLGASPTASDDVLIPPPDLTLEGALTSWSSP